MTPRKLTTFYIDPDLAEGLKKLKAQEHLSEAQIIRTALREHLKQKGVIKSERKRAGTRRVPLVAP